MKYINSKTGQYPYSTAQLKKDNPGISFPKNIEFDTLIEFGVYPVHNNTPKPEVAFNEELYETAPILNENNEYEEVWEVRTLSSEELEAKQKEIISEISIRVQERLDNFARTRNYDGIVSLCTYATSNIQKFKTEGQIGVNLRDLTWDKCYEILEAASSGLRQPPESYEDIEQELPELTWE